MPKNSDRSTVSFGSWFLTIFMVSLPCVGFLYVLWGAFRSPNESRRNFYRAHLAWLGVILAFYLTLIAVGAGPGLQKLIDRATANALNGMHQTGRKH